jgi:hypothetical protein
MYYVFITVNYTACFDSVRVIIRSFKNYGCYLPLICNIRNRILHTGIKSICISLNG